MRPAHRPSSLIAALFAVALATGCNEEGTFPGSRLLSFSRFSVSDTSATIGDTITVRWNYANGTELRRQRLKLLRLGLGGVEVEERPLARALRTTTFTFDGPVTVVIVGQDRSRREIDAATDVRLDQIYHFTAAGVAVCDPRYPRLGQPRLPPPAGQELRRTPPIFSAAPFDIEFTSFFGIYEMPPEDGVIDALREVAEQMPTDQSFFARSFDVNEAATPPFRFTVGSAMPFLDVGFLSGEGAQFFGTAHGDGVVFAGKIAYDGEERRDRRSGRLFRTNVTSYDPIFAALDLRSDDGGNFFIADAHLGNSAQGLVVSVHHGANLNRHMGTYNPPVYTLDDFGAVGEIQGDIKSSLLAFGVTPRGTNTPVTCNFGGVDLDGAYVEVDAFDWHVQFLPDTDLTGVQ